MDYRPYFLSLCQDLLLYVRVASYMAMTARVCCIRLASGYALAFTERGSSVKRCPLTI
jgi:hypothetical protein